MLSIKSDFDMYFDEAKKLLANFKMMESIKTIFEKKFQLRHSIPRRNLNEPPSLPDYLSSMDLRSISDLHNQFCMWYSYISDQMTQEEMNRCEAKRRLEARKSEIITANKDLSDSKLKTIIETDREILILNIAFDISKGLYESLESHLKTLLRGKEATSRELTRRIAELENNKN